MKLKFILSFKYGQIFRDAINVHELDFCDCIKNSKFHPLARMYFDIAAKFSNFADGSCPHDEIEIKNLTIDIGKIVPIAVFPTGRYRANFTFYTDEDEMIYQVSVTVDIVSSDKETLGWATDL